MTETALVKSLSDIESDREVKSLTDQAMAMSVEASSLAVFDEPSSKRASEVRLEASRILKMLEVRRKFFVDPHNQFVKMINAWFKNPSDTLSGTIDVLGRRMVQYSDDVEAAARVAEAKILADKRTSAETKSTKIAAVPQAPTVVRSETGSTGFRIDKRLEIVDELLIPRQYLVVEERFVLAALKAGKEVPGARLIDVKVPVGRSSF